MQLRNRQIEGQDSSPLQSPLALLESPPVTTADRIAEDAEEQRQMSAMEWACNSEE